MLFFSNTRAEKQGYLGRKEPHKLSGPTSAHVNQSTSKSAQSAQGFVQSHSVYHQGQLLFK